MFKTALCLIYTPSMAQYHCAQSGQPLGRVMTKLLTIFATLVVAALFYLAPATVPVKAFFPCGSTTWLPADTALAQVSPCETSASSRASSWVAGGHAGYNWQQGATVYGLETDLSVMRLYKKVDSFFPNPEIDPTYTSTLNWYGTVRGRLGWVAGQALFYGTGGLAYGSVKLTNFSSVGGLSLYDHTSKIKAGWVAGGGVDYMLRPDLILNLAYQYVDLGTVSMASTTEICCLAQRISAHAQFQLVTVGLSWRFGADNKARNAMASAMPTKAPAYKAPPNPWAGVYVGGHVGGAWGNKTNADYLAEVLPP
jgi:outer membrane immunogenic protein